MARTRSRRPSTSRGPARRPARLVAARLRLGAKPRPVDREPLVYSLGLARWRVIEPGSGAAYAVLFSELGISLLITTLVGVLVGRWIDAQLGRLPVFVIVGFLVGAGSGTLMIYRLVSRFLKTIE